jgi:hypothetical protein
MRAAHSRRAASTAALASASCDASASVSDCTDRLWPSRRATCAAARSSCSFSAAASASAASDRASRPGTRAASASSVARRALAAESCGVGGGGRQCVRIPAPIWGLGLGSHAAGGATASPFAALPARECAHLVGELLALPKAGRELLGARLGRSRLGLCRVARGHRLSELRAQRAGLDGGARQLGLGRLHRRPQVPRLGLRGIQGGAPLPQRLRLGRQRLKLAAQAGRLGLGGRRAVRGGG